MTKLNDLIARLIDCGLSRDCAVRICQYYRKYRTYYELEQYVRAVEAENHEPMEAV